MARHFNFKLSRLVGRLPDCFVFGTKDDLVRQYSSKAAPACRLHNGQIALHEQSPLPSGPGNIAIVAGDETPKLPSIRGAILQNGS